MNFKSPEEIKRERIQAVLIIFACALAAYLMILRGPLNERSELATRESKLGAATQPTEVINADGETAASSLRALKGLSEAELKRMIDAKARAAGVRVAKLEDDRGGVLATVEGPSEPLAAFLASIAGVQFSGDGQIRADEAYLIIEEVKSSPPSDVSPNVRAKVLIVPAAVA